MKFIANSLSTGFIIKYEDDIWFIINTERTKPGKGVSYVKLEVKNVNSGFIKTITLRSNETIERPELITDSFIFLHNEGDNFFFMNENNYEQISINKEIIGDNYIFLEDGAIVKIGFVEDNPVIVSFPTTVSLEIIETDAVVKGQSATSATKPALVGKNKIRVTIPGYLKAGDKILVNTETKKFCGKA